MPASGPIQLFISYAAADEAVAIELEKHLALLQRSGALRAWSARKIGAGEDFRDAVDRELLRANLIVFLVSADFLASDYLYDREMRAAVRRHDANEADIVLVLARPCDTRDLFLEKLHRPVVWLPKRVGAEETVAVSLWDDRDEALASVVQDLRKLRRAELEAPLEGPMSRTLPKRTSTAWNITPRRLHRFTGRNPELEQLGRDLDAGRSPVAVFGLGGVGKTELAFQYARVHEHDYDIVWWVRAAERATLAADIAALAAELKLPGSADSNQRVAIDVLARHLMQRDRWLLIFDAADDPNDVEPFLATDGGHVIITTRNPAFGSIATATPLGPLDPVESVELLLKITRRDEAEAGDAAALANALGHLPLALVQAGAYIVEAVMDFSTYRARFEEQQGELLQKGVGGADSVATTYGLAFNEVLGRSRAAAELLSLFAFLAPDDIPRDVLRTADTSAFPDELASAVERDPLVVDAIKVLGSYSLVEPHQRDSVRVHRLVQAVVRDRLSAAERAVWAGHAVSIVLSSFPVNAKDYPDQWPAAERWYPHAMVALAHADRASAERFGAERLMRRAASYMFERRRHSDALNLYARALAIVEEANDTARVATNLSGMAASLHQLRDFERAEEHVRRALAIEAAPAEEIDGNEQTTERNFESIARDKSILALILCERWPDDRGKLNEALDLAQQALRYDEAISNKAAIARDAACLGKISMRLGKLGDKEHMEKAKVQFERALNHERARLSPGSPELISRLHDLAVLLRRMDDPKAARALLYEALEHEADPLTLASLYSTLGDVLVDLKDFERAKDYYERAIAIGDERYREARGREITDAGYILAIRRNNLGMFLSDMGDHEGALVQLEQAVTLAREALRPDHSRVKKLEKNLRIVRRKITSGS